MRRLLLATLMIAMNASAQTAPRGKAIGTWDVEYDHTTLHMHGEPTHRHDHGHMSLRADGDSLFGELVIGDSATASRSILRGVPAKAGWTLYVEDPTPKGIGIFFSAIGAAMDWMRETMHGIQPTMIRLDVTAKGDSISGSRTVTGGMSTSPRVTTLAGKRVRP